MIPIIVSVRGVILASLILAGLTIFFIINNTKDKSAYDKSTGIIEYFAKEFQHLPHRDKGDFRYLKVDTYPYLFEIYEPNSEPTEKNIDDLNVGDNIDIYYYETSDVQNRGLNKFTQFIDKEGQPYFIKNGFQQQLGFVILGLCVLMNMMAFVFWKMGKLSW